MADRPSTLRIVSTDAGTAGAAGAALSWQPPLLSREDRAPCRS